MSNWKSQDAAALHKYLSDHPEFLAELKSHAPQIKTTTVEETAMTGAKHSGAEDILAQIEDMRRSNIDPQGTQFIPAEQD
jgi:uncharacterized protein YigA (DUF484 family)